MQVNTHIQCIWYYIASVLMYFNGIHCDESSTWFKDGRGRGGGGWMFQYVVECFNMWDSKLNIHMFSLLWENKENMRPLFGASIVFILSSSCYPLTLWLHYDLGCWYSIGVSCATTYSQVILCSISAMLHCPHNRDIFSIVSPTHLVFAQAEMMVIFFCWFYIQM